MIFLCLVAWRAIQRRSLDEIAEGQVRRGQIRRRTLNECWSGNPAGCWAGPVYIHPRFQGGQGEIGVLNSDWPTIWDTVDVVGARRSEDAPLGHSCLTCWFQAAFLEEANFHWSLTSAGSLCWNWGELNSYWLATQAGSLGQPCGMLNCYWRRVQAAFPCADEAVAV